ncbi:MAG: hypothetical protein ACRD1L_12290, partial [Terriglobales bacterium]
FLLRAEGGFLASVHQLAYLFKFVFDRQNRSFSLRKDASGRARSGQHGVSAQLAPAPDLPTLALL